jgi:hypothetical protein
MALVRSRRCLKLSTGGGKSQARDAVVLGKETLRATQVPDDPSGVFDSLFPGWASESELRAHAAFRAAEARRAAWATIRELVHLAWQIHAARAPRARRHVSGRVDGGGGGEDGDEPPTPLRIALPPFLKQHAAALSERRRAV